MSKTYNQIAGQRVERLAALSDGIFGVAMTLLLLDLHVPAKELVHSEGDLLRQLRAISPQLVVYLMSFLTLGIFWVGQQTQLNYLTRSDRHLTWLHLEFLFCVTIMPFSTRFLAEFIEYRTALVVYWGNIFWLGMILFITWGRARQARLIAEDVPAEIHSAICRRILVAQSFYALAMSVCIFSTYWSIVCIVLLQLFYVIAPRLGGRRNLED